MKTIYKLISVAFFIFQIFIVGLTQITVDPVSPGPPIDSIEQCMGFAADLKPRVLRFPAGGDHKFMHLLDDNGYGYRELDIDAFIHRSEIPI